MKFTMLVAFAALLFASISSASTQDYFLIGYIYDVQEIGQILNHAKAADDRCFIGNGDEACIVVMSNVLCQSKGGQSRCQFIVIDGKRNQVQKSLRGRAASRFLELLARYDVGQCKDGLCEAKLGSIACGYNKKPQERWGTCDVWRTRN